ncbi:MAG: hypothetical protein L3J07_02105 [Candidatus Magasanikbacteria bacterium]|nr:hypothetical protein [Candidatus Magasanikbacteria bacterium]
MKRNKSAEERACDAVKFIEEYFGISADRMNRKTDEIILGDINTSIILGTGWGETFDTDNFQELKLGRIPGFETLYNLEKIEGHSRKLLYGQFGAKNILALSGRIHLNEDPGDLSTFKAMVRLQVDMLLRFGVKNLIVTCAVGSLTGATTPSRRQIGVGDVVTIKSIVTLYVQSILPGYGGEFGSPEDSLDDKWREQIVIKCFGILPIVPAVTHVMVRGPFFEGRKKDKEILARDADVVGMSLTPELSIASLWNGVKVLGLGFVTNTASEKHSHEENQKRAKEKQKKLSKFLETVVEKTT